MRILVLTPEAYGGHGGIAQYSRDFLEALTAYPGCEKVTALPRYMPKLPETLPVKLRYIMSGVGSQWTYIRAALALAAERTSYDLVFCAHIKLLPLAFPLKLRFTAPLVLSLYGIEGFQPISGWPSTWLAGKVDAFITMSVLTQKRFIGWSGVSREKGFILPNAVHLSQYAPGRPSAELVDRYNLSGKRVIMTLGRLSTLERAKGFDEILESLPVLLTEVSNLVYVIAGEGDDRYRLEQKTRQMGLEKHVVFTGYIREEEKLDHYRLADVFAMPSRGEGFGFVFLEAMACGIPVVASKIDGSREAVLDGQLGVLVDPRDPQDLRNGILQALGRPKGQVPAGLEYFSSENNTSRIHAMLDRLTVLKS